MQKSGAMSSSLAGGVLFTCDPHGGIVRLVTPEDMERITSEPGPWFLSGTRSASSAAALRLPKQTTSYLAEGTPRAISAEPAPAAIINGAQPSEDQGD